MGNGLFPKEGLLTLLTCLNYNRGLVSASRRTLHYNSMYGCEQHQRGATLFRLAHSNGPVTEPESGQKCELGILGAQRRVRL
jgi:hypothetical protein